MKLRNKIILVSVAVLMLSGIVITGIWYHSSNRLMNDYLTNVSESTMKDACHAFEYLLTDTSYMATMISANEKNVVIPVQELNSKKLKNKNQWNQTYLDNRRTILEYINSIDGYKYYISGISIAANKDCIFSANHMIQQDQKLYDRVLELNQEKLKRAVVMMEPMHMEGRKSTISSDYVVPAVRGILNAKEEIIGYVIIYFDYGVISQMFSANLPEGSYFEVTNEQNAVIYATSNYGIAYDSKKYVANTFYAENVGWTFQMLIPAKYYLADIQRASLVNGIFIGAIILCAICIMAALLSKLTEEITILRNKMTELSDGDLNVQYVVRENDEIGQMGATFNQMVGRISELMDKVAQEEKQKRAAEMAFLQAQINPHFISNVLNNVVWMAKIQHADNIIPLVNALNYMMRAVIHEEKELVPLKKEIEYVENYLIIMEYSGSYDFVTEKNIVPETLDYYVPRFILQPIVENAIYYGVQNDLSRQEKILIETHICSDHFEIWIEDNGGSLTKEEQEHLLDKEKKDKKSFNGVGIGNVNERIKLCFGGEYGLRYVSEHLKYTRCIFVLPVIKEAEKYGKN